MNPKKNTVIPISWSFLFTLHIIGVIIQSIMTLPTTFYDANSPLKNTKRLARRQTCNTTANPIITL